MREEALRAWRCSLSATACKATRQPLLALYELIKHPLFLYDLRKLLIFEYFESPLQIKFLLELYTFQQFDLKRQCLSALHPNISSQEPARPMGQGWEATSVTE